MLDDEGEPLTFLSPLQGLIAALLPYPTTDVVGY